MKCPTCKKNDAIEEFKPFCSKRCKEIDLGNWFGEKYSIAESYVLDDKKIKNDDDCKN